MRRGRFHDRVAQVDRAAAAADARQLGAENPAASFDDVARTAAVRLVHRRAPLAHCQARDAPAIATATRRSSPPAACCVRSAQGGTTACPFRDAIDDDVDNRIQRRRVSQPAVEVRSGAAVAAVAVAPRTLRVEDPLTRGEVGRLPTLPAAFARTRRSAGPTPASRVQGGGEAVAACGGLYGGFAPAALLQTQGQRQIRQHRIGRRRHTPSDGQCRRHTACTCRASSHRRSVRSVRGEDGNLRRAAGSTVWCRTRCRRGPSRSRRSRRARDREVAAIGQSLVE